LGAPHPSLPLTRTRPPQFRRAINVQPTLTPTLFELPCYFGQSPCGWSAFIFPRPESFEISFGFLSFFFFFLRFCRHLGGSPLVFRTRGRVTGLYGGRVKKNALLPFLPPSLFPFTPFCLFLFFFFRFGVGNGFAFFFPLHRRCRFPRGIICVQRFFFFPPLLLDLIFFFSFPYTGVALPPGASPLSKTPLSNLAFSSFFSSFLGGDWGPFPLRDALRHWCQISFPSLLFDTFGVVPFSCEQQIEIDWPPVSLRAIYFPLSMDNPTESGGVFGHPSRDPPPLSVRTSMSFLFDPA